MNSIDALAQLGQNLLEKGVLTDAISLNEVNQIYNLGFALLKSHHYEKAKNHFEIVTKLCPIHHLGLICLGICHFETHSFELAKRCFEIVDFLKVEHPLASIYKGYLALDEGNKVEAIFHFQNSLKLLDEKDPNFLKITVLMKRLNDEY